MALKTGTGPGTIVGDKNMDNTNQATSKDTIESILRNVVIANQICRHNFENTVADDAVYQFQVVVL